MADRSDGWMPAGIPTQALSPMFQQIKSMAQSAGRDPNALELIVRANLYLTPEPVEGAHRPPFVGSLEQVAEDARGTRAAGANELIWECQFSPDVQSLEDLAAKVDSMAELSRSG